MGIRGRVRWVSKGNHSHRTGSVDCECPISDATSVRATALILANSQEPHLHVLGSELELVSVVSADSNSSQMQP